MIKKNLIRVWEKGDVKLLEEKIVEVEDDKWKGIVLHQPGTRATAEEINEPTETRTDLQDPRNKD